MHAPQGVGALYVRKGTTLHPMIYGGSHERSRRAGTENVPGIVALGKAAELASEALDGATGANGRHARSSGASHPERSRVDGVNGEGAPRVPNTTNIYFDCIEGEALVIALDLKGLAVSTGAACSSGAIEPSHVLTAMGLRAGTGPGEASVSVWASRTRPKTSNLPLASIPRDGGETARALAHIQ